MTGEILQRSGLVHTLTIVANVLESHQLAAHFVHLSVHLSVCRVVYMSKLLWDSIIRQISTKLNPSHLPTCNNRAVNPINVQVYFIPTVNVIIRLLYSTQDMTREPWF